MSVTKEDIHNAINAWPCLYEDTDGNRFVGETVSSIPKALRDNGWRRVGRGFADGSCLKSLGCDVRRAQYVGGARPTGRFVDVVYVRPWESNK